MVSEKQRRSILDLYKAFPRISWIASQVGLTPARVRHVVNRTYPQAEPYPESLQRECEYASKAGVGIKKMAYELGVSESKIKRVRSHVLTPRQRQPLGRPGSQLTPVDQVRIRRKLRQALRAVADSEGVQYRTLRRILRKIL
jgi:hypothetical protein